MRVALLLWGQPRFYHLAQSSDIIDKIITPYNADVYCHTWWSDLDPAIEGARGGTYDQVPDPHIGLQSLYSPTQLVVEPPVCKKNEFGYTDDVFMQYGKDYRHTKRYPSSGEYLSAYLSQKRVRDMVDETKYDFIVRWRYDLKPYIFPDLEKLDPTKFYVMMNGGTERGQPIFDDCGQIFGPKCIRTMSVYEDLDEILQTDIPSFDPEWVHLANAKRLNIIDDVVKLEPTEFWGRLIRSKYNV